MSSIRAVGVAVVTGSVLLVSACGGGGGNPPETQSATSTTTAATPSSGITPSAISTPTPTLEPGPAAVAVYRAFTHAAYVAFNKRSTAGLDLESLAASGQTLDGVSREVSTLISNKQRISGQLILQPTVVSATELVVHLADCTDNSHVTVVDANGKSVKAGPTRVPTKITVQRQTPEDPWLVTKTTADYTGATKC